MEKESSIFINATYFHRYHMIYELLSRFIATSVDFINIELITYTSSGNLIEAVQKNEVDLIFIDSLSLLDKELSGEEIRNFFSILSSKKGKGIVTVFFVQSYEKLMIRKMISHGIDIILSARDTPDELVSALIERLTGRDTGCYLSSTLRSESLYEMQTDKLTAKEWEVINMIYQGYSLSEIAERRFRAVSTIATQKRNAMDKLHVKNHGELLRFMQQNTLF